MPVTPTYPQELTDAINRVKIILAKLKIATPIIVQADLPPAAPAGFTVTPGLTGNALAWTANTENDLAATPYVIERSTDGDNWTTLSTQAGVTYNDANATCGVDYFYRVTAVDAAGNASAPAGPAHGTRPVPLPVAQVTASPTAGHDVVVSWSASTDPAHQNYILHRTIGASTIAIATQTGTTFTDSQPTQNVLITYSVFNVINNTAQDASAATSATVTIDTAAPADVTALSATSASATSVSLSWTASTANDLAGYQIEKAIDSGSFVTLVASQAGTTYTDNTVVAGHTYKYRIKAFDGSGNYSTGATVSISPIPNQPASPTNLSATVSATGIALAWSAVSGASTYNVYSSTSPTGTFAPLGSPATNSFNDTSATAGIFTYYRVTAVDAYGQESAAATVNAMRPGVPGVPQNLTATGTTAGVTLIWTLGAGVAHYNVSRATTLNGSYSLLGTATTATYADTTGTAAVAYFYRVTAVDAYSQASAPASVSGTRLSPPPLGAPTNLTTTASAAGITLTWTAVTGASAYRIYSSASSSSGFTLLQSTNSSTFVDTTAATGVATYYRVTDVNGSGVESAYASASATRPAATTGTYFVCGTGDNASSGPTFMAPPLGHATHVHAHNLLANGEDWADNYYSWDFGDSQQLVTDQREPNDILNVVLGKGTQNGPKAVYVYKTVGTYTITLTIIKRDLSVSTYQVTLTVPPANRTVYQIGPTRTLKTMADVGSHIASNTEFLLDGGNTYVQTAQIKYSHFTNVMFKGVGGTPAIHAQGITDLQFDGYTDSSNITFENIKFETDYTLITGPDGVANSGKKGNCAAISAKGMNVSAIDCVAGVTSQFFSCNGLSGNTYQTRGALLLRCTQADVSGLLARMVWAEGEDVSIIGSSASNSLAESPVRCAITGAVRYQRAYNRWEQQLFPSASPPVTTRKPCVTTRCFVDGHAQNEYFLNGDVTFDPNDTVENGTRFVLERCKIVNGIVRVKGHMRKVHVRNNLFINTAYNHEFITLEKYGGQFGPTVNLPIESPKFYGNTFMGGFASQRVLWEQYYNTAFDPKPLSGAVFARNLYVNPVWAPDPFDPSARAVSMVTNDMSAWDYIGANIFPRSANATQTVCYVQGHPDSTDGSLDLRFWNFTTGGTDWPESTTLTTTYQPTVYSAAANFGEVADEALPPLHVDYYGQPTLAGRIGAVNPSVVAQKYVSPTGSDSANGSSATPWRTIQKAATASVAGTEILVSGSTYRETVNCSVAGLAFKTSGTVIISAADVVTNWTNEGSNVWSTPYTKNTTFNGHHYGNGVGPDYAASVGITPTVGYPDQVIVNGDPRTMVQVITQAELAPGKFYVNYPSETGAPSKLYAIFPGSVNPNTLTVEIAMRETVIGPGTPANNIAWVGDFRPTYAGNLVQKQPAVVTGTGWRVAGMTQQFANAAGISVGNTNATNQATGSTDVLFWNVNSKYNGQLGGTSRYAQKCVWSGGEFTGNNYKGFTYGKEASNKFSATISFVADRINAHDNEGPGIWFDNFCYDSTVSRGTFKNCRLQGAAMEISAVGLFLGNTGLANDAADSKGQKFSGCGIWETTDVVCLHNTHNAGNGGIEVRNVNRQPSTRTVNGASVVFEATPKRLTIKKNTLNSSIIAIPAWNAAALATRQITIDFDTFTGSGPLFKAGSDISTKAGIIAATGQETHATSNR